MNTEQPISIRIYLDAQKQLKVETTKTTLPELIQLCLATIEASCKQVLLAAEDPNLKKALQEDMFEMINLGASALLEKLFPDIELRPDLTVDAMLEAENKLMQENGEKYVEAYEDSAQAAKDVYEHNLIKENLKKRKNATKTK